jgi:hypothetical protein
MKMKRFFASLAVLAAMSWAMPLMAAEVPGYGVTIGGTINADTGWQSLGEYQLGNESDGRIANFFAIVNSDSNLRALFTSADKTTGAHIELGFIGITNGDNSGGPADNGVELRYAYGWWNVGNCKLLVGQMDGRLGDGGALQALGNDKSGKGGLAGFGFIGATRNPKIALEVEANDNVAFQIALGQAGAETSITFDEPIWTTNDVLGSTQSYLPRLEAVVDFTFENISFGLGAGISYQKAQYNDATLATLNMTDTDDSVLSYLLWIPIEFNYGPFSAVLNAHYGRNVDTDWTGENTTDLDYTWNPNGVYGNQPGSLPVLVGTANGFDIEDTTQWGIGLDLNFELRENLVLGLGGGFTYLSNDGWAVDYPGFTNYGNDSYHRWGAYVALAYAATDNFTIQPEIGYYNYGDRVGLMTDNGAWVHPLPDSDDDDAGDEWIFGVHFSFNF